MDTNKLLKLLNINIVDLSKEMEVPELSKLIDSIIFGITHPTIANAEFYKKQCSKLEKIEVAIERAQTMCGVAKKVLATLLPGKNKERTSVKNADKEKRIVLGTGYPWLDSLAQDDNIQRISLYSKKYGDGKLVNLKVGDATSSKKYRLVLEKL